MEFTTYQLLAFAIATACMGVVIAIARWEGARSGTRRRVRQAWEIHRLRGELNRLQLEHSISRRDAALALEVLTEERDTAQADAAALRLRLITTREQLEALQAQQQERAA